MTQVQQQVLATPGSLNSSSFAWLYIKEEGIFQFCLSKCGEAVIYAIQLRILTMTW